MSHELKTPLNSIIAAVAADGNSYGGSQCIGNSPNFAAPVPWEAERKGIAFEARVADDLPDLLHGRDPGQSNLRNLLSNAFKFTASGRVLLAIYWAEEDRPEPDRRWIAFQVRELALPRASSG